MIDREEKVRIYFTAWLNKDAHAFQHILAENITYSECFGPEYHGINQVNTWFEDWNRCGTVRKWDIKQFVHQNNTTVVEWYFECFYDSSLAGFDGVSLIEFDENGKISSIKEFQSKAEHHYPYGIL